MTINKKEGKYTVLYGVHIMTQDPADIPADTDAVVLETGIAPYLSEPQEVLKRLKEHIQYRKVFEYLEKNRIPVIFTDVKYRINSIFLLLLDNSVSTVKLAQGIKLFRKKGSKRLDRAGELLLAGWLVLPFVANAVRLVSAFSKIGMRESSALKKLTHQLHPDTDVLLLTARNALIAEKNSYLAKKSGYKHVTTVMGAAHVGIEELQEISDDSRLGRIKQLMPVIKSLISPEYFYKAVRFRFNGRSWEMDKVLEVPQLKTLVT